MSQKTIEEVVGEIKFILNKYTDPAQMLEKYNEYLLDNHGVSPEDSAYVDYIQIHKVNGLKNYLDVMGLL